MIEKYNKVVEFNRLVQRNKLECKPWYFGLEDTWWWGMQEEQVRKIFYTNVISHPPEHDFEKHYKLKKGDIYLDIGSLFGGSAFLANRRECSKIILVEPSPLSADVIQYGLYNDLIYNAILIRKAIGDRKGVAYFSTADNPLGHKIVDKNISQEDWAKNLRNNNIIPVEVDTIDGILTELEIAEPDDKNDKNDKIDKNDGKEYGNEFDGKDFHIDLMTCDCEGCEYLLVLGAQKYMREGKIKNVALATYHVDSTVVKKIEDCLKEFGYNDVITEEGMTFAKWNDNE